MASHLSLYRSVYPQTSVYLDSSLQYGSNSYGCQLQGFGYRNGTLQCVFLFSKHSINIKIVSITLFSKLPQRYNKETKMSAKRGKNVVC